MYSVNKSELTQDVLKELIHYDPDTGIFTWKERDIKWFSEERYWKTWNSNFSNKIAGNIHLETTGNKYERILIFGKQYQSHRLSFLYIEGHFPMEPKKFIDHIDGNGLNNKWENLRKVTAKENSRNRKRDKDNLTGQTGVSINNEGTRFYANIHGNNGIEFLGSFKTLEEAIIARKAAEVKYNYHPNHGRDGVICQSL